MYERPRPVDRLAVAAHYWKGAATGFDGDVKGFERLPATARVTEFLSWCAAQVKAYPGDVFWEQIGQAIRRSDISEVAQRLLDRVEPKGQLAGRRAYATIYRDGEDGGLEVFLVHPTGRPWRGAVYWLPGGAIEPHESPREAVERELLEETGIDIGDRQGRPFVDPKNVLISTMTLSADEDIPDEIPADQLQLAEVDWAGFVPYEDAIAQVNPHLREAVVAAALSRVIDLTVQSTKLPRTKAGRFGFDDLHDHLRRIVDYPGVPESTRRSALEKFEAAAAEDWTQGARPRGASARAPSQIQGAQDLTVAWMRTLAEQAREKFPVLVAKQTGIRVRLDSIRAAGNQSLTLGWRGSDTEFFLQATFTIDKQHHILVGARSLVAGKHHHTMVGSVRLPWDSHGKAFQWAKAFGRDPWSDLFARVGVRAQEGWTATEYPTIQPTAIHIEQQAALARIWREFDERGITIVEIRREPNGRVLVYGAQGSARALIAVTLQGGISVIRPPHLPEAQSGDARIDLGASAALWRGHSTVERLETPEAVRKITPQWAHKAPHYDRIPGGLADGMHPVDFDAVSLAAGTREEMEHTNDPHIAREIAMDHLVENPHCYDEACRKHGLTFERLGVARHGLPTVLYHGTSADNLPGILRHGLVPSGGSSIHKTKTKSAVFVTDKFEAAMLYATANDDAPHAILTVRTDGLDLHPDYDDAAPIISADLMQVSELLDPDVLEALGGTLTVGMEIPDEYQDAIQDAIEELNTSGMDGRPPISLDVENDTLVAKPYVFMDIDTSGLWEDPELYEDFDLEEGTPGVLIQQFQVRGPIPLDHIEAVYIYPVVPGYPTTERPWYSCALEPDEEEGREAWDFARLRYSKLTVAQARSVWGI